MRKSKLLWVVLLVCITLLAVSCDSNNTSTTSSSSTLTATTVNETLQVHYIDVGQADSILIKAPDGTAVLIDAGNKPDGPNVVNYLKSQQIKELAAIIATHPHEDHIGGLDTVIKSFPVKAVYMPNASSTTKTFEEFISAVKASGAKRIQAKAGVFLDVPGLTGQFLAPNGSGYEDLNNYSAVLRLTCGKITFLFTGDAEEISEKEMLSKSSQNLRANVLKVGHHGSNTSTTSSFLKAVSPQYAIISVESGNDYGHPADSVLSRLSGAGIQVFRTDKDGTIVATCDGESVNFNKQGSVPTQVSTSSVAIAGIDLVGEVVTIVNNGSSEVDLTGWKLVSEKGNQTYSFPGGITIAPDGTLKVLSGPKAVSSKGALVWTNSNMWSNDGDPGVLYNAQGQVVSRK